jgi:pilus assembly protein Flp/PilA
MWNDLNLRFQTLVKGLERDEGQALVEYALVLALVSVVAVAILTTLGGNIVNALTGAANAL